MRSDLPLTTYVQNVYHVLAATQVSECGSTCPFSHTIVIYTKKTLAINRLWLLTLENEATIVQICDGDGASLVSLN